MPGLGERAVGARRRDLEGVGAGERVAHRRVVGLARVDGGRDLARELGDGVEVGAARRSVVDPRDRGRFDGDAHDQAAPGGADVELVEDEAGARHDLVDDGAQGADGGTGG